MVDFARQLLHLDDVAEALQQPQEHPGSRINEQGGVLPRLAEKRVCNQLLKDELRVVLDFPTYREGLTAIHRRNLVPFLL